MSKVPKINLPRTSISVEQCLDLALRRLPLNLRPLKQEDAEELKRWARDLVGISMRYMLSNCQAAAEKAMAEIVALMIDPEVEESRKRRRAESKEYRRVRKAFGTGPPLLEQKPKTRLVQ